MPLTASRTEYATINSVPVPCQIVECMSLLPLWQAADVRGSDRLVPGSAGVRPYKRRPTVSKRSLELIIYGANDHTGAAASNVRAALEDNVAFLNTQWVGALGTGDGTVTAVLHLPSGATRTASVHCIALNLGTYTPSAIRAVLDLEIPAGALA